MDLQTITGIILGTASLVILGMAGLIKTMVLSRFDSIEKRFDAGDKRHDALAKDVAKIEKDLAYMHYEHVNNHKKSDSSPLKYLVAMPEAGHNG
jgi:hypothetical protein